jgi:ketosteroid isomerase-like protein
MENNYENAKKEIIKVETEFQNMARDEGIENAFLHYASIDAVLFRQNKLIKGKKEIQKYFTDHPFPAEASLEWKPDFVEISESGDLAYTYGTYTFSGKDESGQLLTSTGIFHTVWKKQPDGQWKYVWD